MQIALLRRTLAHSSSSQFHFCRQQGRMDSKTLLQLNALVLKWECWLMQDALCNGCHKVLVCVRVSDAFDCGRLKLSWWRSQARRCLLRCPTFHAKYYETSITSSDVRRQFVAWFSLSSCCSCKSGWPLRNLEMSGNLTAVRNVRELIKCQGSARENLVRKTVYC